MSPDAPAPDAPPGNVLPFPRARGEFADALNHLRDTAIECAATLVDQTANAVAFGLKSAFTRQEVLVMLRETAGTVRRLKTVQPEPPMGGAA